MFLIERNKKTVSIRDTDQPTKKAEISMSAWDQIKDHVFFDFDKRLAAVGESIKWHRLSAQIDKFLAKELILLFLIIRISQPEQYQFAAKNWAKLRPEDRWYFYLKIKAHGEHWLKGAYFALAEY